MSSGVVVYEAIDNGQDFIFKELNSAGEKIDDIKKEKIIGKKVTEVFPGVKDFGLFEVFQRVWKNGNSEQHPISLYKDERITGWRKNYVFKLSSGEIIAIYNDVSKQKRAEEELKESEKKYRSIIENTKDAISIVGLDGKMIYASPRLSELLGMEITQGELMLELFHPDDLKERIKLLSKAIKNKSISLDNEVEFRLKHKDGHYIWVSSLSKNYIDDDGNMVGFITSMRDITAHKLTEEEIKDTHRKLDQIFNASIPMYVIDLNYNIIMVNDRFCQIFQENKTEILGKKCYDVWKESLCHTQDCSLKQILKGNENYGYERIIELEDDTRITCIVQNFPFKNQDGQIIGAIKNFIDITKKRTAEMQLREKEQKLSESKYILQERVKELTCIYNLSKLLEEPEISIEALMQGLIYLIPPAMQSPEISYVKILYDEVEYTTTNYKETKWKIVSRFTVNDQEFLIEVGHIEEKQFLKEEKDLLNEIEHRIKIFIEKKEIEEKIKKSEEKYRGILQNIKEGYYEVDLKGICTYANNAFSKLIEYPENEVLGLNYNKIMDESMVEYVFKEYKSVYNTGIGKKDLQFKYITKSGSIIDVESSVELKYDSKGNKTGFFGLVRDITKRKKMDDLMIEVSEHLEEEVELRTKELRESLKEKDQFLIQLLKSSQFKTQFLATMSHELRTPLNAIIGFTDLLLEGILGSITDVQREYIDDIKSSADHQFKMIQKILDISKIESGQIILEKINFYLRSIIEQVMSNFKLLLEQRNLKLAVIGMENDKEIHADPIRFKEILDNLLSNAIKYTIQGEIKLIITENNDSWIFKVKDTGIGVAEKDFDKIFKEFQRVDSPYVRSVPGTGLGLSLTKRLVNLHGGTITFDSKIEVGTIFTFTIPKKTII